MSTRTGQMLTNGSGATTTLDTMTETAIDYQDTAVEVHRLVVGPMDNNVYIVRCRATGTPCSSTRPTSTTSCWTCAGPSASARWSRPTGTGTTSRPWTRSVTPGYRRGGDRGRRGDAPLLRPAPRGRSVIEVGRLRMRTIATPGHTPGSMCFTVEGTPLLFSGDTLFPGGPGNTSFEHSDFPTIISSIEDRLFASFGPDTLVLPGTAGAPPSAPSRPTWTNGSSGVGEGSEPSRLQSRLGLRQSRWRSVRWRWKAGAVPDQFDLGWQAADRHPAAHLGAHLDGDPRAGQRDAVHLAGSRSRRGGSARARSCRRAPRGRAATGSAGTAAARRPPRPAASRTSDTPRGTVSSSRSRPLNSSGSLPPWA